MAKSQRYAFLDVLRAIAVIWMIQVHVTNVFLDTELRSGWFFTLLNISNGFVAPTFIFCAGGGLWIALSRKGAQYLALDPSLWQYLKRLAYILFWAYVLHMPAWSLVEMTTLPTDVLFTGFQVDVLQTIVYSSLFAVATFFLMRDLSRTSWTLAGLCVIIWLTTAMVWKSDLLLALPAPIAIMVSPPPASPFPLIPWSAYLFAGLITMQFFMRSENKQRLALWYVGVGLLLPALIFSLRGFEGGLPWSDLWWSASPGSQVFRICGILFLWGLLYLNEERLRSGRVGRFLQEMGTESLFLYLSHLLIVYGQLPDVLRAFGFTSYGYGSVVVIWIGVTLPLLAVMHWWHRLKAERPTAAKWILVVQVSWLIASLIVTPPNFQWKDLLPF
jgi:uncharacterized membrane protein